MKKLRAVAGSDEEGGAPPRGRARLARSPTTRRPGSRRAPYPYEVRRRAVQLHLEESIPVFEAVIG